MPKISRNVALKFVRDFMKEDRSEIKSVEDMHKKIEERFTWEQQFYIFKYLVLYNKRMWHGDYYREKREALTMHLSQSLYTKNLTYVTIKK